MGYVRGCNKWSIVHYGYVNSYNEEKLDFTTRLFPRPCARWLVDEDMLLLILVLQQATPPTRGGRTCSSGFDTIQAVVVTVRLLEEAKSQAQPGRSCGSFKCRVV